MDGISCTWRQTGVGKCIALASIGGLGTTVHRRFLFDKRPEHDDQRGASVLLGIVLWHSVGSNIR